MGQLIADTEAEGPGRRFAIWVQGCPLRCSGCCNPEFLPFSGGQEWPTDDLLERILSTPGIEGVTFLGGEPLSQPAEVLAIARGVQTAGLSVMVFTGFTRAELTARGRADIDDLLDCIDILVDGRYDREQPDESRRWIGSRNQTMYFSNGRYSSTDECWREPQTMEIRLSSTGLVVNGWPVAADEVVRALGTGSTGSPDLPGSGR